MISGSNIFLSFLLARSRAKISSKCKLQAISIADPHHEVFLTVGGGRDVLVMLLAR